MGGLSQEIGGGDFLSGFLSAGFRQFGGFDITGNAQTAIGNIYNTITSAVVGGTSSVLGGGKFMNGAVSAAFTHLFSGIGGQQSSSGSGFLKGVLDVVGKIWALPNTLIGTMAGLAGVPFGATIDFANNAIQFLNYPWGHDAITLGNAQIYTDYGPRANKLLYDSTVPLNVGLHEQAHTYQYQVLGPLFLPAYAASGGISSSNSFERAANDYAAGGGWWPW